MIPQNEIKVQGRISYKTDNRTVSYKHRTRRILVNDVCKIIPYRTVEEKNIWQVYITRELKVELFCFFTVGSMVWIFTAVKNRY